MFELRQEWSKAMFGAVEEPETLRSVDFVIRNDTIVDFFRCLKCLRMVSPRPKMSCAETSPLFREITVRAPSLHHSLVIGWVEGSRLPIVYCTSCGGFSMGRGTKLSAPCVVPRLPTSELRKLRKGEVPGTQLKFGKVVPLAF